MENSLEKYQMQGFDLGILPEQYVQHLPFHIFYLDKEKGEKNEEECGHLTVQFADVRKIKSDGLDCDEVLESKIREFNKVRQLYKHESGKCTCNLKDSVYEALQFINGEEPQINENFIYLETLQIIEKHRRIGVGIYFLEKALPYLAKNLNFGFFVMFPYPLQNIHVMDGKLLHTADPDQQNWNEKMGYETMEKNRDKAREKLRKLYAEIGFNLVKNTDLMVCRTENFNRK